ncbi:MAG TPA: type II secretion system protein GspM [Alcaligenes sp.]|nr:type II secretion system protein GspM [Alcaligenes sp.]HRL26398.1 type II secretion system protein GspM [Alcaligenes sp.]
MKWSRNDWPALRLAQDKTALFAQRWRQVSRRDQRALLALLGAVLVLVLWIGLLRPAWRNMAQARETLPRLQYEQAQLKAVLSQIRLLEQQAGQAPLEQGRVSALESSVQALGGQCRLDVLDESAPSVHCRSAPAGALMDWLLQYPNLLGMQVQSLSLSRSVVDSRERPGLLDGLIQLHAEDAP